MVKLTPETKQKVKRVIYEISKLLIIIAVTHMSGQLFPEDNRFYGSIIIGVFFAMQTLIMERLVESTVNTEFIMRALFSIDHKIPHIEIEKIMEAKEKAEKKNREVN